MKGSSPTPGASLGLRRESSWKLFCIQNFINNLDEKSIPKAILMRMQRGYSNKRIAEDFKAMMFQIDLAYVGKNPVFVVPYCNLALNIGIAHGLALYKVVYPESGYFANPENTLDDAYVRKPHRRLALR